MRPTENEVNGAVARKIREDLGLTQGEFWEAVGVQQSVGCRYESGTTIPKPVRILLVTTYIAGLVIDTKTEDGIDGLSTLARVQLNFREAKHAAAAARSEIERATVNIARARDSLARV